MFMYMPVWARQLHNLTDKYISSKLKEQGIAYKYVKYVMFLHDNKNHNQNEICDKLHYDKAHTSRILSVLEQDGYVEKIIDPQDNRKHIYDLTRKGNELADKVKQYMYEWQQIILADVSKEQIDACKDCATKIIDNATKKVSEVEDV